MARALALHLFFPLFLFSSNAFAKWGRTGIELSGMSWSRWINLKLRFVCDDNNSQWAANHMQRESRFRVFCDLHWNDCDWWFGWFGEMKNQNNTHKQVQGLQSWISKYIQRELFSWHIAQDVLLVIVFQMEIHFDFSIKYSIRCDRFTALFRFVFTRMHIVIVHHHHHQHNQRSSIDERWK